MNDLVYLDCDLVMDLISGLQAQDSPGAAEMAKKLDRAVHDQRYGAGESVMAVDGRVARNELEAYNTLRQRILQGAQPKTRAALENLVGWWHESDEHPFFCESTLYELLGKDAARSLLGRLEHLCEAFGTTYRDLLPKERED